MPKPFIAARIPQIVQDALDRLVEESGRGKTDIIVNALAEYLGCSIDAPEETRAVDRLIAVEKELAVLRDRITALEKPKKQTPSQQELFTVSHPETKIDNKAENNKAKTQEADLSSDKNFDNKLLTHKQMSELSGMKFETVKSRHRKSIPIEWQGEQYNPVREGKSPKWHSVNSTLSNIDNTSN